MSDSDAFSIVHQAWLRSRREFHHEEFDASIILSSCAHCGCPDTLFTWYDEKGWTACVYLDCPTCESELAIWCSGTYADGTSHPVVEKGQVPGHMEPGGRVPSNLRFVSLNHDPSPTDLSNAAILCKRCHDAYMARPEQKALRNHVQSTLSGQLDMFPSE